MDLIERIKDNFNNGYFGKVMSISELPTEYPAWTINDREKYGVIVPTDNSIVFNETFACSAIETCKNVEISGNVFDVLMLTSNDIELKSEFAVICSQFVAPGNNGDSRKKLISDPQKWWENWKKLLGNIESNASPYPYLGELKAVEYYLKKGYNPKWTGPDKATNDIEFDNFSSEVKSTTERTGKEITVSSVHQLNPSGEKLELIFCRFEKSAQGYSIDDTVESLVGLGYDKHELNDKLTRLGFPLGCVARKEKYKILEMIKYLVDDRFPVITEKSFKNDILPSGIIGLEYTIDLSSIEGENIK